MKTSLALFALLTTAALADDIGIRLRLGLEDKEGTDWSGTVAVAPGNVALIGGWRFAQTDKVDGTTGWSCRTRPVVLDQKRRSNNPHNNLARIVCDTAGRVWFFAVRVRTMRAAHHSVPCG